MNVHRSNLCVASRPSTLRNPPFEERRFRSRLEVEEWMCV